MARRGRFGRSETGASNLSATIRQLVMEQQAAEEKALMDAFYNGSEINGAIPTMEDVRAFYAKWVDITGLTPEDADWQLINQKIEGANNFDVQRIYKDLKSTFESTNGSNFSEMVSFLNGKAKESTDQNDLNVYEGALGVFASNYIQYRSEDLKGGRIKIDEYRSMAGTALSLVGEDDPIYGTMLNDTYQTEWNIESRRKWNLVLGGKMGNGAYTKWANGFKKDLLESGIPRASSLYAEVVAELGRVNKISVGSAARKRLDADISGISSIWSVLKSRYGAGEETFYFGKSQSNTDLANEILQHPEWAQAYHEFLQDNPNAIDPSLAAAGVTADNFLSTFEGRISSVKNEAILLESQGVSAGAGKWTSIAYNSGVDSVFDYLRYVDKEWQRRRFAANENDQEIAWLDNQYTKFITGQESTFGNLGVDIVNNPSGRVTSEQYSLIVNQYNAMADGTYTPGIMTISSYGISGSEVENTIDPQLSLIKETVNNATKLDSGQLVNVWNEKDQKFEAQSPRSAGLSNGQLQVVVVYQMEDGTTMAQTQVVLGKQVTNQDGEKQPIWSYAMPDGSSKIVGNDGMKYDATNFTSLGDGTFVLNADSGTTNISKDPVERVYISIKDTRETAAQLASRPGENYLEKIAPANLAYAENLRIAATAAVEAARGILDPAARAALLGDQYVDGDLNTVSGQLFDILISSADQISAEAYRTIENPTPEDRATAEEYSGNDAYANFLRGDLSGYEEIRPNYWVPKDSLTNQTGGITSALGNLGLWSQQNPALSPLAVLPGLALTAGAVAENVFGFGRPEPKDFRSEQQKQSESSNNKAMGAIRNAQQIASVQDTGYNYNPFFRNLSSTPKATAPSMIQPTGYLGLQANYSPAPAPKAISPNAPVAGPSMIRSAPGGGGGFIPSVPKKLTPIIINSGPRKGLPAGGGV